MVEAVAISAAPPDRASQDFELLRLEALAEIQARAARTWTDHNLHDPGITVMEAFCYAMTELGLRLELGMADLIESGRARAEPALAPAEAVLPTAPVTMEDLRRQLLDHYLVGDAWPRAGAADRIAYYADPLADPPLSYLPAGDRLTPSGLYEVLLAFEDPALNTNTYPVSVAVGPDVYDLDMALPHWDEPEAQPFRAGGVTLDGAAMLQPGFPWLALGEDLAWFGRVTIDFTGPGGPGSVETWVVLRIVTAPEQPALTVPGILSAAQAAVEDVAAGGLLDQFALRVAAADAAAATVARYLQSWRNLCEDPVRLAVSRVQEIAVNARVRVGRSTRLEELLAAILFDIDAHLSPPVRFADPLDLRAAGLPTDAILLGPLLTHGVLEAEQAETLLRGDRIFVSDVLNLVMAPRDEGTDAQENPSGREVVAVTELSISNFINNRGITLRAGDCLQLVDIARHRPCLSVAKSRIVFERDDVEIAYDRRRVEALFAEMRAAATQGVRQAEFDPAMPPEPGEKLPVGDYYPFQNDLPAIYGLGEAGLPAEAGNERRQQALQLRAYLMLFEQFLTDTTETLASINRLFSPAADETRTYFTRPLTELADLDRLVAAFPGGDWPGFAADPDNPYAVALHAAAEDEALALDRRNRMLDHLLARHGEDAVAFGQELHRWGQKALLRTVTNLAALPARIDRRRTAVNRMLLATKAAFLADVPRLHALRLQGFGDVLQWEPGLVDVRPVGDQFSWQIVRDGTEIFEGLAPVATEGEAIARAREVLRLGGSPQFYGAQNLGGANNRRYVLRSGTAATDPVLAQGVTGFANLPDANAAAVPAREGLAALILRQSRTGMERRIDHLIGIREPGRRVLLGPLADRFEIVDAPGAPFTKGWRLWSDPGFAGTTLLAGAATFNAPVEADAIAAAVADIERVLEFALDPWNWRIDEPVPGSFVPTLVDMDDAVLAVGPAPLADASAAESARDAVIALLYARFGVEGFHTVETLLLRPQRVGDEFLAIPGPDGEAVADPYSHRLLIVFPSGYVRDFAATAAEPTEARPHRFRDPEFRRHAERIVEQSCPAHILPQIRWVDRQAPGSLSDASFDTFETRYFDWLRSLLLPGAPEPAIAAARNALVASVNAIMGG